MTGVICCAYPAVRRVRQITFIPARGPPGWMIVFGTLGVMTAGIYVKAQDNVEQK